MLVVIGACKGRERGIGGVACSWQAGAGARRKERGRGGVYPRKERAAEGIGGAGSCAGACRKGEGEFVAVNVRTGRGADRFCGFLFFFCACR